MLKQILNKIRCYYMELAGFIHDEQIVSELLTSRSNSELTTPKITKIDIALLFVFLSLASFIIVFIPTVVSKKLSSSIEILNDNDPWTDFTLQTGSISRYNYAAYTPYTPKSSDANEEFMNLVGFFSEQVISKTTYEIQDPKGLAYQIVSESLIANQDPFFIAALVFSESSFRTHARSNVGALGLMQIMPKTGEYIAKKINYQWRGVHTLNNPTVNLRLGISYLQYLDKMFKGNIHQMLLAYNWGPTNVKKGKRAPIVSLNYSAKIQKLTASWKNSYSNYTGSKDYNILQKI